MNSTITSYHNNIPIEKSFQQKAISRFVLKFSKKSERKILKVFLLSRLHQLFYELFLRKMQCNNNVYSKEYYAMDSQIMQLIIQGIIETGEYTLEGIAFYTRIPFDIIYDAACGINNQFSITPWARVVDLYLQLKPDVAKILIDKLIEIKKKDRSAFSLLLTEE